MHIPTPQDDSLLLQDTVTKTATFKSAGIDLGLGANPGGVGQPVVAIVKVTAAERDTGDETYTFKLQEADDDVDAHYADAGLGSAVPVSGTSATLGVLVARAFRTKRWMRLVCTIAGTVTTGVTYKAWLNPNV